MLMSERDDIQMLSIMAKLNIFAVYAYGLTQFHEFSYFMKLISLLVHPSSAQITAMQCSYGNYIA